MSELTATIVAERKLLARMIDPAVIAMAWGQGVRPEWFEESLHQALFCFSVDYWQATHMQSAPTAWVLAQEFRDYVLPEAGEEDAEYLISLLRRRLTANRLQEMTRSAAANSLRNPVAALKELSAAVFATEQVITKRLTSNNIADGVVIDEFWRDYRHLEEHPQGIGLPYGIDLLDEHTGGLQPGELAVIGGGSKTGKTMFGLWAAAQLASRGHRPIVFTLEMSLRECRDRLYAMYSGVSYNRLIHGRLSPEEQAVLNETLAQLREMGGGVQLEMPGEGDRTVGAIMGRARHYGADWVFIDQLSFMESGRSVGTLKEHRAAVTKALKVDITRAGAELPCLLAVQFRREEGEPTLQSFADAAEIERDTDVALGLWRTRNMVSKHAMRLDILGGRRSPPVAWLLNWELLHRTNISAVEEIR